MKDAVLEILKMSSLSDEDKQVYIDLCDDAEAVKAAKELEEILYAPDAENIGKYIYATQGEKECLIFALMYLFRLVKAKKFIEDKNIPLNHFQTIVDAWDTTLRRSFAKFGHGGINWIYRSFLLTYMKPARFIIERLNFEMHLHEPGYSVYKTASGIVCVLDGEPAPEGECLLKPGDKVLGVHIPEGKKLSPEWVDDSFREVKVFFDTYFPEYDYKAFVCSSWLLDENLKKVLPEKSNIIHFQNRFTIPMHKDNNMSLCFHVFGIDDFLPPEKLTPKNAFQESILNYVKAGNQLQSGKGFILKDQIK